MSYADIYRDVDFRQYPAKYRVGRGEQGVLPAEPDKSEILPYWQFATPKKAKISVEKIIELFQDYKYNEVAHVHAKLYPFYGKLTSKTDLWSKQKEFVEEYRGWITTLEEPHMDDERLIKFKQKILNAL